jgi:hypothetical protein
VCVFVYVCVCVFVYVCVCVRVRLCLSRALSLSHVANRICTRKPKRTIVSIKYVYDSFLCALGALSLDRAALIEFTNLRQTTDAHAQLIRRNKQKEHVNDRERRG